MRYAVEEPALYPARHGPEIVGVAAAERLRGMVEFEDPFRVGPRGEEVHGHEHEVEVMGRKKA